MKRKKALKGLTLNERCRVLGIAVDLPVGNRAQRRVELKRIIKEEMRGVKVVNGEEFVRHVTAR